MISVKRSKDYYLNRLTALVEGVRSGKEMMISSMSVDTRMGILDVFDDYLFSKWLLIGDTAFNREGYRNATDKISESLKEITH